MTWNCSSTCWAITPLEALRGATMLGGQLMDMGDELGLLAPGYLADLLVVRGDPAGDVQILQDPAQPGVHRPGRPVP